MAATWADSKAEALARWNTRPIEDALIAMLERVRENWGYLMLGPLVPEIDALIADAKGGPR
jgi:hypothetical protein